MSKKIFFLYISLVIIALLFVINVSPLLSNDSNAYFGMWPYVSAGYPIFIRGLHYLFEDNYPIVVVGIQYVAVMGSIFLFLKYFLSRFELKKYQLVILVLLLFYPVFDSNIYLINNISTEGLSFAIFLQVIYFSYLSFIKRNIKSYVILTLLMILLITIRGQFRFLIVVFLLIEALLFWKENRFFWRHYVLFLMIPLFTFAIDNTYHKVVQKQFFSTPFTFTTLVTSVFFVSDDTDIQYLDSKEEKTIFKLVKSQFKLKEIGYQDHKYFEEPIDHNYFFYHYEHPTLCNQTVQQDVVAYYLKDKKDDKQNHIQNHVAAYLKTEKVHKKIFFNLLPHVFDRWIALAFQNFKTGIGGISVALLYLISLILLFVNYLKSKKEIILCAIFLLLCILINRAIISVSIHGLTRYFFYTHWMSVFLLFLGINKIQKKS